MMTFTLLQGMTLMVRISSNGTESNYSISGALELLDEPIIANPTDVLSFQHLLVRHLQQVLITD